MDVAAIIADMESQSRGISYRSFAARFRDALAEIGDADHPEKPGILAEHLAFSFTEQIEDPPGRDRHFGPEFSFTTKDGQTEESPSLSRVTKAVLDYWARRADATPNQAMRARYADLVWDLSRPAGFQRPDVRFAQAAIDSSIDAGRVGVFEDELDSLAWIPMLTKRLNTTAGSGSSEG